jgi:hypothetical protein
MLDSIISPPNVAPNYAVSYANQRYYGSGKHTVLYIIDNLSSLTAITQ